MPSEPISRPADNAAAIAESTSEWYLAELYIAWRDASTQANDAYAAWREAPGPDEYAAYVAATDREEAAADNLASEHARRAARCLRPSLRTASDGYPGSA
jgi:hypothetical protein